MKKTNTKKIVKISALGAISFVLYFILEFPLIPGAPFLKFDFSDTAALVGGFALGPAAGVLIEFIKNILHLLLKANEGSPVGELANFIVGTALVLPAIIIYKKNKSRKSALLGMIIGIISLTVIAALFNYFVFIPLYSPALLDSGAFGYIMSIIVPFNLLKGAIVCVVTFVLYKYISPLLHK